MLEAGSWNEHGWRYGRTTRPPRYCVPRPRNNDGGVSFGMVGEAGESTGLLQLHTGALGGGTCGCGVGCSGGGQDSPLPPIFRCLLQSFKFVRSIISSIYVPTQDGDAEELQESADLSPPPHI
jgi:hypothetical protein